jgi:hypothetical protein
MSPVPEIKDLAERAVRIEQQYKDGKLTFSEYAELANDLLELKTINTDMMGLELTRELWQVVTFLKNLKFFSSLV